MEFLGLIVDGCPRCKSSIKAFADIEPVTGKGKCVTIDLQCTVCAWSREKHVKLSLMTKEQIMKFCANPKCIFYVEVARSVHHHTMLTAEPMRDPLKGLEGHVTTTTREKHLWRNPKKGTEWFFCDVCHEAASMVEEDA